MLPDVGRSACCLRRRLLDVGRFIDRFRRQPGEFSAYASLPSSRAFSAVANKRVARSRIEAAWSSQSLMTGQ